jgi:hypothetical protein
MPENDSTGTAAATTDTSQDTAATHVEKTYTQAEHDADMAKQRIDAKAGKAAIARVAELEAAAQKLADAEKSEAELLKAEIAKRDAAIAERDAAIAKRDLDALRARIGTEKGLSAELASRLVGDDEDSIGLDADKLLAAIPKSVTAPGGANPANAQPLDLNARYAEAVKNKDAAAIIQIEMQRAGLG